MSAGSQIERVCARVLRVEVTDGIAMSFAPLRRRAMVLVEVHTADGAVGYGESWVNYPPWAPAERLATLSEGVFPLVLGACAEDVSAAHADLRARLLPLARQWGAPGPVMQAISAVDIALWDRLGRVSGQSVAQALGTRLAGQVPVYASSLGPSGVTEQAGVCRAAGHTAVKVKVGFGRDTDARILAEARESLGPDIVLYADANQAWTVDEAVAAASMLAEFGVSWIEEPVVGNQLADLEELHRRTDMAIATGENVYGIDEFASYVDSPAISVLQPDVAKTGGLTECRAICERAQERGKPVLPHLYGGAVAYAATLQLAASASAVTAVEYDVRENPLRDPLLRNPPRPESGTVRIPEGPGLGVELNSDTVRAYQEDKREAYLRARLSSRP